MKTKINIAVWWVKDYETGRRDTLGGLERWTRDLVRHLIDNDFDVHIYQKSKVYYKQKYNSATITGVKCSKNFIGNITFYSKLKRLVGSNEKIIFLSQDLVWGNSFKNSIAVNHGVWWSSRQNKFKRWLIEYFNLKYIQRTKKTICVDSNYINWVIESVNKSHELIHKLEYIPNYYDENQFMLTDRNVNNDVTTVLFPRRIMGVSIDDEPRGGADCIKAVANLIHEGFSINLTILGEGNLTSDLKKLVHTLGIDNYVQFKTAHFDEISNYYKSNEVVMVPSRFSEGTSLSAIEALASNCFVISSCVGGLQNLPLFPPYGKMTEPTPEKLTLSLRYYIENKKELLETKRNHGILDQFKMSNWSVRVLSIIDKL